MVQPDRSRDNELQMTYWFNFPCSYDSFEDLDDAVPDNHCLFVSVFANGCLVGY